MGRVEGKVAFITGAARGQGRSHAIGLAREGADIIAVDICAPIGSSVARPATEQDLAVTVDEVQALGRRIITAKVDVRDFEALQTVLDQAVAELGRLDIVCANAGIWSYGATHELSAVEWSETIDIVLTGTWHTCKAAVPHMLRQSEGGSIILTSSALGLKGVPYLAHYVAAKHGLVGLMRTMALELSPHLIRVNTVNPGTVSTDLIHNVPTYSLFAPDIESPTQEQIAERMQPTTVMPVPWVECEDVTNAVLYLASDESRYVTGTTMVIDAGSNLL